MSHEKIIAEWKKKVFKPFYWLEGEEEYFIDKVVDYAEHNILSEAETGFNLTVFYGKDAAWPDVINYVGPGRILSVKYREIKPCFSFTENVVLCVIHNLVNKVFLLSFKPVKRLKNFFFPLCYYLFM